MKFWGNFIIDAVASFAFAWMGTQVFMAWRYPRPARCVNWRRWWREGPCRDAAVVPIGFIPAGKTRQVVEYDVRVRLRVTMPVEGLPSVEIVSTGRETGGVVWYE